MDLGAHESMARDRAGTAEGKDVNFVTGGKLLRGASSAGMTFHGPGIEAAGRNQRDLHAPLLPSPLEIKTKNRPERTGAGTSPRWTLEKAAALRAWSGR